MLFCWYRKSWQALLIILQSLEDTWPILTSFFHISFSIWVMLPNWKKKKKIFWIWVFIRCLFFWRGERGLGNDFISKIISKICYRNKSLIFFFSFFCFLLMEGNLDWNFTHQNYRNNIREQVSITFFSLFFVLGFDSMIFRNLCNKNAVGN